MTGHREPGFLEPGSTQLSNLRRFRSYLARIAVPCWAVGAGLLGVAWMGHGRRPIHLAAGLALVAFATVVWIVDRGFDDLERDLEARDVRDAEQDATGGDLP